MLKLCTVALGCGDRKDPDVTTPRGEHADAHGYHAARVYEDAHEFHDAHVYEDAHEFHDVHVYMDAPPVVERTW